MKIIKKSIFLGVLVFIFSGIISCEKDFTDIGTSIINNSEFSTNDTILEVEITSVPVPSVRADGLSIGGVLGQYLLGVYNNPNYQKIEASIVSQLALPTVLNVASETDSTSVHTELDTVFLRIPYQATLVSGTTGEYTLDSIIGDKTAPFTLNVFETGDYLNSLNPSNPSQTNSYSSDKTYTKVGSELNAEANYQFTPNPKDTVFYLKRKLQSGATFIDTLSLLNKLPFARIPLKKEKFQEFMSKYEDAEFDSQDAFNNYFRGIILEASGDEGSLLSLSLTGTNSPSIEVYYTNTVTLNSTAEVLDTIKKNDSFILSGVRTSVYKMGAIPSTTANQFVLQGTAGNMANVKIFKDGLADLRSKNWLINDASLTFYVDQDVVEFDTIATPYQLFLYKNGLDANNNPNLSQIKDILYEGPGTFGGKRELSENKKPNKYSFQISDYVSDLLNGNSDYNPVLGLKVLNTSDYPTSFTDTIVRAYNWNPKAVTLLNHISSNGTRRAQLKISYSEKK